MYGRTGLDWWRCEVINRMMASASGLARAGSGGVEGGQRDDYQREGKVGNEMIIISDENEVKEEVCDHLSLSLAVGAQSKPH